MNITKVINNNVVSSRDEQGNEVLVMGKGLGFQKKAGDQLDQEKVEKVFALTDEVKGPLEQVLRVAIVRERVQKFSCSLVYVVKAFALGKPVPAKVACPGLHFRTGDGSQFLTFPGAKVEFDDGVFLFDGQTGCRGCFFGKPQTA